VFSQFNIGVSMYLIFLKQSWACSYSALSAARVRHLVESAYMIFRVGPAIPPPIFLFFELAMLTR
jgi:hypothetical protein